MSSSQFKAKKSSSHLRPCVPLRFSAKQAEIVLNDICPHRKKFTSCQRYFCVVAFEKFQWLELVREKSKEARQLVQEADQFLRSKLMTSFNSSIENLHIQHENELENMRRKFLRKSSKHKLIDENLNFLKFYELDKKDPLETDCPLGFTKDHVDFIVHQHQRLVEQRGNNMKSALDHKKYEQSLEVEKLKQSIDSPLAFLDHLLNKNLELIEFHAERIEKIILYILNLCVVPRSILPDPPEVDDPMVVSRVKKASSQAFQLLKTTLSALANLCGDVRKIYCNAEEEISLLLRKSMSSKEVEGASNLNRTCNEHDEFTGIVDETVSISCCIEEHRESDETHKRPNETPQSQEVRHEMKVSQKCRPRRKLTTENKVIARMSDTKLNNRTLLTSIINRAKQDAGGIVEEKAASPDQNSEEILPWNKKLCCFCGKRFRGPGKLSPSITNRDADVRSRAKMAIQQDKAGVSYVNKKVNIALLKFGDSKKALLADLELSTADHSSNSMAVFCSWVCVKRWTVTCCPMQYKYQSEMLIDMVAGYSVKI